MKSYTLNKASQKLGVSRTAIYGLIKNHDELIKCQLHTNENGKKTLTEEGINLLRPFVKGKREEKYDKKENVTDSKLQKSDYTEILKEQIEYFRKKLEEEQRNNKVEIKNKNDIINKLIENQEKERERSAQERERTDTIIMKLTQDLERTRKQIEDKTTKEPQKKEEPPKTEARKTDRTDQVVSMEQYINSKLTEEQEQRNFERLQKQIYDPLQGKSLLYKFYIKMFRPDKLRGTG